MITPLRRLQIANDVIAKIGTSRAKYGTTPPHPPEEPKWGFDGVDRMKRKRRNGSTTWGKFRARIRFCESAEGKDCRVTLGMYDNAEEAGFAYREAHIAVWGSLSYFVQEVTL